jgi:hypothetical protein
MHRRRTGSEWSSGPLFPTSCLPFEADPPFAGADKRRFGHSRDHRPDCVQAVIALVVTPEQNASGGA